MATQWYYSEFGLEFGPVAFTELVRLVREGQLQDDDLVRSTDETEWRPARSVTGLFHMARRQPGQAARPSSPTRELQEGRDADRCELFRELCREASAYVPHAGEDRGRRTSLARLGVPVLVAIGVGVLLHAWSAGESMRFPGVLEARGTKVFPLIGECKRLEYWTYFADLLFAAGVAVHLGIRWAEDHLE